MSATTDRTVADPDDPGTPILCRFSSHRGQKGDGRFHLGRGTNVIRVPRAKGVQSVRYSAFILKHVQFNKAEYQTEAVCQFSNVNDIHAESDRLIAKITQQTNPEAAPEVEDVVTALTDDGFYRLGEVRRIYYDKKEKVSKYVVGHIENAGQQVEDKSTCLRQDVRLLCFDSGCCIAPNGEDIFPHLSYKEPKTSELTEKGVRHSRRQAKAFSQAAEQARVLRSTNTAGLSDSDQVDAYTVQLKSYGDSGDLFRLGMPNINDRYRTVVAIREHYKRLQGLTPQQKRAFQYYYVRAVREHHGGHQALKKGSISKVSVPQEWAALPSPDLPVAIGASTGAGSANPAPTATSSILVPTIQARGSKKAGHKHASKIAATAARNSATATMPQAVAAAKPHSTTTKKMRGKRAVKATTTDDSASESEAEPDAAAKVTESNALRGGGAKRRKIGKDAEWVPQGGKPTVHEEVMRARNEVDHMRFGNKSVQQAREKLYPECSSCPNPLADGEVEGDECAYCRGGLKGYA